MKGRADLRRFAKSTFCPWREMPPHLGPLKMALRSGAVCRKTKTIEMDRLGFFMQKMCALCEGTTFEVVSEQDRHGKPLRSVLCLGCGVITNDPIPSDEDLAAFYRKDYRVEYKGSHEPRMRQVWRNFGRIEDHLLANRDIYRPLKTCLDLGSGSGEFMFLAGAMGMDCIGVEPNDGYAAYSQKKLGLKVLNQTLEASQFADGSFDLIRLSHVLEHMRDPVRSLKVLHGWLRDEGVLYIEVPNIEADGNNKMRGTMFHFGHIYNFNPLTLRLAAGLAGFEEIPASAARLSRTTGAFFRKVPVPFRVAGDLAANGARLHEVVRGHNARTLPAPKEGTVVGRFFATFGKRLKERMQARRYSDHRSIAEAFKTRLMDRLSRPA